MSQESDRFERVVRDILCDLRQHFGYVAVNGKKKHRGQVSGRNIEIDATAYRADGGVILVECRQRQRPVDADQVGAVYHKVFRDTQADGALIVSAAGFQDGAEKVATAETIGMATLNPEATRHEYLLDIAGQLFRGVSFTDVAYATDTVSIQAQVGLADALVARDDLQVSSMAVVHDQATAIDSVGVQARCACGGVCVNRADGQRICEQCGASAGTWR
jgi:hypothetical protein